MVISKKVLLASVASFMMASTTAHATDTFVSFGDSLSDAGNVFALTGGLIPNSAGTLSPLGAQSPNGLFGVFSTRFSTPGGLTAVEQLAGGTPIPSAGLLTTPADFARNAQSPQSVFFNDVVSTGTFTGVTPTAFDTLVATSTPNVTGNVNLAVGGAFAGAGNLGNGVAPGTRGFLPGVREQIDAFATSGGTLGATDTVTYWAGANNFFVGLPTVADAAGASALGQAVTGAALSDLTDITTGATIAGDGPGQIVVFNLPNLGLTPAIASQGPAAAGAAGIATSTFNAGLQQGVNQLAATDANTDFIFVDVAGVFDLVVADPAAFGLTNVTTPCLAVAACVASTDVQEGFLFADGVHPTNTGYAFVNTLASQLLNPEVPGATVTGLQDAPVAAREAVAGAALGRARSYFFQSAPSGVGSSADLDVTSPSDAGPRGAGFIEAVAGTRTIAARGVTSEVDTSFYGARLGADIYQDANTVVGFQASFVTGSGSQPLVEFEPNSFGGDIYAARRIQNVFGALSVGAASVSIDNIERSVGLGNITNDATTDGHQISVVGEVGYDLKLGSVTIVPSAQLGYVRTQLDGYTESGVFAPLSFGERTVNSVTGALNVRVAKNFSSDTGLVGQIYAGVGYEDYLVYDANNLNVNAVASTAAPTSIGVGDPDGRGFLFDVGARFEVNETFSVAADYALGIGSGDTQSHQGSLRLISRF